MGYSAPGGEKVVDDHDDVDRLVALLELLGLGHRREGHPLGRPALKPHGRRDRADEEGRNAQQKP